MTIKKLLCGGVLLMAVYTIPSAVAGEISCSALNYTNAPNGSDVCLSLGTTDPYNALLRQGTSSVGVLFLHGRGQDPNGDVVRQLRNSLNADGYTTLSIENPIPPGPGGTSFSNYVLNENLIESRMFARVEIALAELKGRNVDRVVLGGFSLGSRFATASAAAWELNQLNTSGLSLIGLLGGGMYSSGPNSTATDIFVLNTISNLSFISSIPVLDIYGDNDAAAATTAAARRSAYQGNSYTQIALTCPDINGGYFVQAGSSTVPYYSATGDTNRCHQLRNGLLPNAAGNGFDTVVVLRGSPDAPLETAARNWFLSNVASIPEPETWLLFVAGLLGMGVVNKMRRLGQPQHRDTV